MAKADYICCDVCNGKVIYDGNHNVRSNWNNEEDWPIVICPTCAKQLQPALTTLMISQKLKVK